MGPEGSETLLREVNLGSLLRHLNAEEEELGRELVSGSPDVSRSWRADNEVYRERSEARLEELRPIFALVRTWCGQEAVEKYREVICSAPGGRSSAGHNQRPGQVAEKHRPSPESHPGAEVTG